MWMMLWLTSASAGGLALEPLEATLDNGLKVFVMEDSRTDTVALHLHYGVGSRDERPGELGCAHLFEHLMFEGSANVPTNQFDTWLTQAGGWNNAYTSNDETAYHMEFPSGALDLALFLESDRMAFLDAGLHDENLANQRLVVLQERAEGYANPHGKDWDAMQRLMWPQGHPYHVPVIGTVADVEGFEIAGVRDFWTRHYRPKNAVLAVVGNVDAEEAMGRIRHWFSDVPDVGEPEPRVKEQGAYESPQAQVGYLEDKVEDRTLWLGWPTVTMQHADAPALDVLSYVLSSGYGTRLDERLQLAGKATSNEAYSFTAEVDGSFLLIATDDATPLDKLQKWMLAEVSKLQRKGPRQDEIDRALKSVRGSYLDRMESPMGKAQSMVDCWRLEGEVDCLAADWARYEAVTPADIQRVAQSYLIDERRVSLSVVPEGDVGFLEGAVAVELP
jgi:zinc protease